MSLWKVLGHLKGNVMLLIYSRDMQLHSCVMSAKRKCPYLGVGGSMFPCVASFLLQPIGFEGNKASQSQMAVCTQ